MSEQTLSLKNLIIPEAMSSEEAFSNAKKDLQHIKDLEAEVLAGRIPKGFASIDEYFHDLVLRHKTPLDAKLMPMYRQMKEKMLTSGEIESKDDKIRRMLRNHENPMGTIEFLRHCDKIREEMRANGEDV